MNRIDFNEAVLVEKLTLLPNDLRVLFAATCAERLYPAYVRFHNKTGLGDAQVVRASLDKLWASLIEGNKYVRDLLAIDIAQLVSLMLDDDADGYSLEWAWGGDALAAVAYALETEEHDDAQNAAWAACRVYEATNSFVTTIGGIDSLAPDGREAVLDHPIVKTELQRQKRDMDALSELANTSYDLSAIAARFRARAVDEPTLTFESME